MVARIGQPARRPIIRRMATLDVSRRPLRLTELTECGGCAAKLGADLLADALAASAPSRRPAELIAGLDPPDDAAAYLVSPDLAIIGTLDFFPPLVDDPRDVRGDRRRQRAVRRLRDGRPGAVRAVDRGVPRGPAARRAGRDLRGRVGEGPRGGRRPRRRPHDPRPGAEVRAGGDRRRASRTACSARAARGPATCCC